MNGQTVRLDAYIRVSRVGGREGETFLSPKLQRERCDGVAKAGGHTILDWHEDLDRPGSDPSRSGFQTALARVEAGETDGIVVARLDRFARSVADAAAALRRINAADGALLSAHESLDTSSSFGRFAMHMMLALAELELDRIREGWDAARASAVARGVHIASRTPTGYERADDGRLVPSDDGETVGAVIRAKAEGASWSELAKIMDAAGVKTPYGGVHWTARSLSHLVSNRVYLGEARSGEHSLPGAHPALIDAATFQLAQRAKQEPPASRSPTALLGGLLRCAGCRYALKPDRMTDRGGEKLRLYRCRGQRAHGRCPAPASVLGRVVEPWVVERFFAGLGDVKAEAVKRTAETAAAEEAVRVAEAELDAFLEANVSEIVGPERYRRGLRERRTRLDDAQAAHGQTLIGSAGDLPEPILLSAAWPELEVPEQRQLLAAGIDAIFLRSTGQVSVPIEERAAILWRGEGPDDLPGPGRRGGGIKSFDFPA